MVREEAEWSVGEIQPATSGEDSEATPAVLFFWKSRNSAG
jgi:hypothetical protein